MSIIINQGYKGFLFKNGRFIKMVGPGKYSTMFNKEYYLAKIDNKEISIDDLDMEISELLIDPNFKKSVVFHEVIEGMIDLNFVDNIFCSLLTPGKYCFWNKNEHKFYRLDLTKPEIQDDFPKYFLNHPSLEDYIQQFDVENNTKGILFFDNKFVKILEPGKYYFTKGLVKVDVVMVPSTYVNVEVSGQELLTLDKVTIRINCLYSYKINNYVEAVVNNSDYSTKLYTLAQLAIRKYVSSKNLDELLASKDEMEKYLKDKVKKEAEALFIDIDSINIKDIILPGEIRTIMNNVILGQKQAEANIISRREEVASTRSLLNTARLMDENKTLYKLKELEYIEKICEHVGNININGGTDIVSTITSIINSNK